MRRIRNETRRRPVMSLSPATASLLAVALAIAAVRDVGAQSFDETAAYLALIDTHIGALAPFAPTERAERSNGQSRYLVQARYGRLSPIDGLQNSTLAVSVDRALGKWIAAGTLGYVSVSCTQEWEDFSDCDSDMMLGVSARRTLWRKPLSQTRPAVGNRQSAAARSVDRSLIAGIEGSAGYSPRQGERAMAVAASFPAGLIVQKQNLRVLPFLSPGIGYGRLGDTRFDEDDAATSFGTMLLMIGGGVGLEFLGSGFGATLGFQKVLKAGGSGTALGLAVSWNGSAPRT